MQAPEAEGLRELNRWLGLLDPTRGGGDVGTAHGGENNMAELLNEDRLELAQIPNDTHFSMGRLRQVRKLFMSSGHTTRWLPERVALISARQALLPGLKPRYLKSASLWRSQAGLNECIEIQISCDSLRAVCCVEKLSRASSYFGSIGRFERHSGSRQGLEELQKQSVRADDEPVPGSLHWHEIHFFSRLRPSLKAPLGIF